MAHRYSYLSGVKAPRKTIPLIKRHAIYGLCELAQHHNAKANEYYEAVKDMLGIKDDDGSWSDYIFADHGDFDSVFEKTGLTVVEPKAKKKR